MHISLITSNISASFLTPPGVPPWDERKALYVQALREAEPNLIALQEVTSAQLQYAQEQLPEFTALTVPIIDPDPTMLATWHAKYAPYGLPTPPNPYELILFYRTAVFESLASGHWWLSPTPERPSIGFGNVAPRAVLWAHLRDSVSRHEFLIFTTHIDHRCTRPMVELCREQFAAFATRGLPLIFAGDFNFNPADANYALLIGDGWRDAHDMVAAPEAATFLYTMPEIPSGRIDHVLYRGETLTPQAWTRLLSPDPKKRLSDHDPVYVRFSLNR